jgi:hypothetical protein
MTVNLSPVAGAAVQFFTSNGAPLAGGKLYSYTAGTTTPQAAYTSSSGNTAWSNPIVLDSAGRVSGGGEVWLTGNLEYKFILKDSNDVLIGTYDNIRGIGDTTALLAFQAVLAGSTGASLVGYLPGGANAVATTVQAKLRESVSVFDFMTAAQIADVQANTVGLDVIGPINNAIAASDNVYFPAGTYSISTAIVCDGKVGFTLQGAGAGNSILKIRSASTATNVIEIINNSALYTVSGFTLNGNSTTGIGLYIRSTTFVGSNNGQGRLEFLYVTGCAVGYWVRTASELMFFNCQAWNAVKGFWATGGNSVDIVLSGCQFVQCTVGIQNVQDTFDDEAELQLFNVNFSSNTFADIRTNYVSRWLMQKVFTEGSNRFMYVHNAGSGANATFNIQNLYVNTITAADNYVIYCEQEITLILTGCNFTQANQKLRTFGLTRLILVGNHFVDPSPLSGISATTKVTFSNELFGASPPLFAINNIGVKAYVTAATVSIANSTETLVTYASETFSDYAALHDAVTTPGIFTVPVGFRGAYGISVTLSWAANVTGVRTCYIKKNGSAIIASSVIQGIAAGDLTYTLTTIDRAADGDTYEIKVIQNSGGALNLLGSSTTYSTVSFYRIGT